MTPHKAKNLSATAKALFDESRTIVIKHLKDSPNPPPWEKTFRKHLELLRQDYNRYHEHYTRLYMDGSAPDDP